ncbi:MAG: DUF5686 and carboxypeptidase regulatory-like domain-containing protein, partial [Prevotellaceae bacterium]|nr:DUF5686 and carboxypeptidase regulatory-like domain-containing protein [Prevotellaceae bacterium]
MKRYFSVYCFCLFFCSCSILRAQSGVSVSGIVADSLSGEPIAYASAVLQGSNAGTMTDSDGSFYIKNNTGRDTLTVNSLGYNTKKIALKKNNHNDNLKILLVPNSYQLNEVVVKPHREKYSKKNNPAVDLIKQVIARKDSNRMENHPQYKVDIYEKLTFSLDYSTSPIEKGKITNPFSFLKNHIDTSEFNGKPVITLSVREKLSEYYYQKQPLKEKSVTLARRHEGVDKPFDQNDLLTTNINDILKDINIFDNNIKFLLGEFVSPLSSTLATSYYRYYILDTIDVAGEQCINLAFIPFNPQSYGFTGQLCITLDGRFAVKKAMLNTPKDINLNWVGQLRIIQEFTQLEDSTLALHSDHYSGNFYPVKGVQELYAHRSRRFSHYDFSPPEIDTIFNSAEKMVEMPDATLKTDSFWLQKRTIPMSEKEASIGVIISELNKKAGFNIFSKCLEILTNGFIPLSFDVTKNRFDFGPNSALIGNNYVEGLRLRLGGMTTANFSKHWFLSGYAAIGFNDKKLK